MVHSLALFEEEDVLCLSDRDNDKVECVRAGVGPVRSNPALSTEEDLTGRPVVTYKNVGRTYAIAPKGQHKSRLRILISPATNNMVAIDHSDYW